MNRREFFRRSAGAVLSVSGAPGAAQRRPNFLLLFADDQRFDTIGALGNAEIRTPNLDRLVRRGTSFTHAQIMGGTVAAVCAPSRAMLWTGQSLFHVTDSIVQPENAGARTRRPFVLLGEYLRVNGYSTFGTGKWHNGEKLYARCFTGGENIFFGGMCDHLKVPVAPFDPSGMYPMDQRSTGGEFSSELFAGSAVRFLEKHRGSDPFFAYVGFTAPHDPRMAPKSYADLYPPARMRVPPNFLPRHPFDNGELKIRDEQLAPWPRTPEVVRENLAAYYAMITHLDAQIGRVLDALERGPHAANTIVIFAADNGLAVGQHGLMGKQNLYDHSVRVPLILAGCGIPRSHRTDALCYLHDLFPTICDLAGLPRPPAVESASLLPLIKQRATQVRDSVFGGYRDVQRSVRTAEWKLIVYNVGSRRTLQLFDLREDPWEIRNLAGDPKYRTTLRDLGARLRQWMHETDDPLAGDGAWSVE
jgi:arylsulfatase A-like enzyme